MRTAHIEDIWRKLDRRKFVNYVTEVNLRGLLGIDSFPLNHGIFAICGLNGTGKTTVLSAIKDIIGIQKNQQDHHKLLEYEISGNFKWAENDIECKNRYGERVSDKGPDIGLFQFVDHTLSTKIVEYFYNQTNLGEYIEQYEERKFTTSEIETLNYMVNREYQKCSFIEIEDTGELGTIPYFRVESDGVEYDTTQMGVGEHFLFYIYWNLLRIEKNSVVIIEEPETFVSIASQKNMMNVIAEKASSDSVTFILSTHSPYIISRVKESNVRVLCRNFGKTSVIEPTSERLILSQLGLEFPKSGTIFVEDSTAKCFLISLLSDRKPMLIHDFSIEIVKGAADITQRLKFPKSDFIHYQFIGIYDGDLRGRDVKNEMWPHCFLPLVHPLEVEFKAVLGNTVNLSTFCDLCGRRKDQLIPLLDRISGLNHHDWFIELCKSIPITYQGAIDKFYLIWKQTHEIEIVTFEEELTSIIL